MIEFDVDGAAELRRSGMFWGQPASAAGVPVHLQRVRFSGKLNGTGVTIARILSRDFLQISRNPFGHQRPFLLQRIFAVKIPILAIQWPQLVTAFIALHWLSIREDSP